MRRTSSILFFLVPFILFAQVKFPQYQNYVNDYANIISFSAEKQMNNLAQEVKQKTGAEIAVVTIPNMQGLAVEDYATRLFEKWGIGQRDKDNGLLFLLAMQERKIKIEVGYGLEGIINDGRAGQILDEYVVPYLSKGNYDKGFYNGMLAVTNIIAKDANVQITGRQAPVRQPVQRTTRSKDRAGNIFFIIIFIILVIVTRGRILTWLFLASIMGGGRGGSFGSGGSFGGGFGGFGGGMSGGGGASRGF